MRLGRQPPVVSPLPGSAFAGGMATMLRAGSRGRAETGLRDWIASRLGSSAVLLTSSGTVALTLAIELAGRQTGRSRVVIPAYGCYDLATACDGAGLDVALYDVDPGTLGPNWDSLNRVLDQGIAAVVVAHLYGVPVDLARARVAADRVGALLIEDAAQGVGGDYHGRPLGSYGDLAVLSFGRGKGLTGGGGGALAARLPELAIPLHELGEELAPSAAGATALIASVLQAALTRPSLYWLPAGMPFLGLGQTPYHPPPPRRGLPHAASGMLRGAVALEAEASAARRASGEALAASLRGVSGLRLVEPPPASNPGYLRFPLLAEPAMREQLVGPDAIQLGITPSYPAPLNALPGFCDRLSGSGEPFDGAGCLANGLFTIPTHRWLDVVRVQRVVQPR